MTVIIYLDSKNCSGLLVFDFFHDPVSASSEDAEALEVVSLDGERLLVDRDWSTRVQVTRDGWWGPDTNRMF